MPDFQRGDIVYKKDDYELSKLPENLRRQVRGLDQREHRVLESDPYRNILTLSSLLSPICPPQILRLPSVCFCKMKEKKREKNLHKSFEDILSLFVKRKKYPGILISAAKHILHFRNCENIRCSPEECPLKSPKGSRCNGSSNPLGGFAGFFKKLYLRRVANSEVAVSSYHEETLSDPEIPSLDSIRRKLLEL